MGYVLFTARKLNLTTRLNNYNYQLLMGAQRRQNMVEQQSSIQAIADLKKSASMMAIYQKQAEIYNNLGSDTEANKTAISQMEAQANIDKLKAEQEFAKYQAEMNGLKTVENALDLEQKRLETLVQGITKELETAEKAETAGIDRATPKYGGASQ